MTCWKAPGVDRGLSMELFFPGKLVYQKAPLDLLMGKYTDLLSGEWIFFRKNY